MVICLVHLSTKFGLDSTLVLVDLLLVCNCALRIVEAFGDLTEFLHPQVENSLVLSWRDLTLSDLVGSLGSEL